MELARQAGVSTSKIRFYEAQALLPLVPCLANGYGDYGDHALRIVCFVNRVRGFGFTLREIAAHLHSPEDDGRKARLQARLEARLAELDVHLEATRARRASLSDFIEEVKRARIDEG